MIKQNEIEEIKKLIKSGFDLDLISFEFDISIEQVKQLKKELEDFGVREETITTTTQNTGKKVNKKMQFGMEQIRQNYMNLYFGGEQATIKQPEQLSEKDIEEINKVIGVLEKKIKEMKGLSQIERRNRAVAVLPEFRKVQNYDLPIEYAEILNALINSQELQNLNANMSDTVDNKIKVIKRRIASKLAEAINFKQYDVQDMEELELLVSKITPQITREIPTLAVAVKNRISNRISAMKQKQFFDRIRNDIPVEISSIITDLANGKIDIEKANLIIDQEAENRLKNKPKSKFSLTKEQERKQILIQIKTAISEKVDKYHIHDPEKTIMQIQQLCQVELGQAITPVVKNLIAAKDFEKATSICDKFFRADIENGKQSVIMSLRKQIRNARIGDMVLKGINMKGTAKEERAYFELIEETLKAEKVDLDTVSLGKSKDGVKNITLANIWKNEKDFLR